MIIDLAEGVPGALHADVAVIGAGAAGLTLARALLDGGLSVVLLESGGADYEPQTADLNRGEVIGEPYYDLHQARLRLFGGTTAIWGGRSAELDPIDFEQRDWVPWSGWPFGAGDLQPWYRRAWRLFELLPEGALQDDPLLARIAGSELAVRRWFIDSRFDRFGLPRNRHLASHPRLTLALHATVREILAVPSAGAIEALDVRSPAGERLTVRARCYVLAAGGLENPRLLLASRSVVPTGLGNGRDLVGRFFMEHPHGRGGRIVHAAAWRLLQAFRKHPLGWQETAALLTASPELQRQRQILNTALTIAVRPPASGQHPLLTSAYLAAKHRIEPTRRGRALWQAYKSAGRRGRDLTGAFYWWARYRAGLGEMAVVLRAEQAPNPDSRVMLGTDTDATGMPRLRLDWRLSPQDRTSAAELVAAFARQLRAASLGTVEPAPWLAEDGRDWVHDLLVSVHPLGGYHHMGTTRMADSPERGVTDGWGRVHGIDNLYVAGSSLFPTGGWANPTLTIVALALRQADRLRQRLRG